MSAVAAAEISCPSCKKKLRVPAGAEGKAIRCPGCKKTLKIPSGGDSATTAAKAPVAKAAAPKAAGGKTKAACEHCRAVLQLPSQAIGKRVKCPKCGKAFVARPRSSKPAAERKPEPVFAPIPTPPRSASVDDFPLTASDFDLSISGTGSPIGPRRRKVVATEPETQLPDEEDVQGGGVRNRGLYVLPATLTIIAGVINILGFLGLAILSLVLAVLTFSIVGIAVTLILGAGAIGNSVNTILGGVNILRMVDRRHGIWAGNMLLISPFFALGFCAWRINFIIGLIVFFACLIYTWPVGWWMVLLLSRKQASRDFDEDPDFV